MRHLPDPPIRGYFAYTLVFSSRKEAFVVKIQKIGFPFFWRAARSCRRAITTVNLRLQRARQLRRLRCFATMYIMRVGVQCDASAFIGRSLSLDFEALAELADSKALIYWSVRNSEAARLV
jgi:hypothetical protein